MGLADHWPRGVLSCVCARVCVCVCERERENTYFLNVNIRNNYPLNLLSVPGRGQTKKERKTERKRYYEAISTNIKVHTVIIKGQ